MGGGGGEGSIFRKTILSHFMFYSRFMLLTNFFLDTIINYQTNVHVCNTGINGIVTNLTNIQLAIIARSLLFSGNCFI